MTTDPQAPIVDIQLTLRSIAARIVGLPKVTWLVVGALQLTATFGGRLPQLLPAGVISISLVALTETYVAVVMLGLIPEQPGRLVGVVGRRLKDVLGFELLEGLTVVLVSVPIVLVVVLALYHPQVAPATAPGAFPSGGIALILGAFDLLAAPFFGRWICALPLIVDRGLGTRTAMRISWTAMRGSTIRCAGLWLLTEIPVLLTVAAPSAVELPLAFLDASIVTLLQGGLSVAVYRQLFAPIKHAYQMTDAGRVQFEAHGVVLSSEGYHVASTVDVDDSREITWSR